MIEQLKKFDKVKEIDLTSQENWEYLRKIAIIVQKRHYYGSRYADDMVEEALVRLVEMVNNPIDDVRNVFSYLYTGARNAMNKYWYHNKREISTEDLDVDIPTTDFYEETDVSLDSVWEHIGRFARPDIVDSVKHIIQCVLSGDSFYIALPRRMSNEEKRALSVALFLVRRKLRS